MSYRTGVRAYLDLNVFFSYGCKVVGLEPATVKVCVTKRFQYKNVLKWKKAPSHTARVYSAVIPNALMGAGIKPRASPSSCQPTDHSCKGQNRCLARPPTRLQTFFHRQLKFMTFKSSFDFKCVIKTLFQRWRIFYNVVSLNHIFIMIYWTGGDQMKVDAGIKSNYWTFFSVSSFKKISIRLIDYINLQEARLYKNQ